MPSPLSKTLCGSYIEVMIVRWIGRSPNRWHVLTQMWKAQCRAQGGGRKSRANKTNKLDTSQNYYREVEVDLDAPPLFQHCVLRVWRHCPRHAFQSHSLRSVESFGAVSRLHRRHFQHLPGRRGSSHCIIGLFWPCLFNHICLYNMAWTYLDESWLEGEGYEQICPERNVLS